MIFVDLISSPSLYGFAGIFTVNLLHMKISMAFLTQKMFVSCQHLRQISQNCDDFCIFKKRRNSLEKRTLAQKMMPGNFILVQIYMHAVKGLLSKIFINLTQECDMKLKYVSHLLDNEGVVNIYTVDGERLRNSRQKIMEEDFTL